MKLFITNLLMLLLVIPVSAQKEYYTSIDGTKGGESLKTALYNLIKNHKKISYGSGADKTWGAFYTTDAVVENGKRRVLDMYSGEKRYFGSKGEAVSGMNIEHSVAKSWWGGTSNNAYCDLHHLNPSDQDANSRKSNYPLGELTSITWDNGVTFVGKANIDGKSQNAFEPHDDYKGDFARTYMYMFTCYQDLTWEYTWMNYEKSTYPTLKPWAVQLLLKWHKEDPVSEKEVNRNNAVYEVQGNRNPFVDYPQLAEYVWGDSINYTFHLNGNVEGGTDSDDDNTIAVPEGYRLKLFEDFETDPYEFTPITVTGEFPWHFEYQCGEVTSYDDDGVSHDAESWLVSSPIDFSNDSIAKITFDYVIRYSTADKVKEYNQLLISRDYAGNIADATWELIDFAAEQNTENWNKTTTGEIEIPATYMGDKNVVLAFKYIGTSVKAGTFEVDNVKVIAAEGENDGNTVNGDNGDDEDEGDSGNDDNEYNNGNFSDGSFTLVTDAAQLTVGDSILIVYENFVMGKQTKNYREKTDVMTSNGKITYLSADAQKIVLEEGAKAGTYAFNVGNGYLAASSSSSNYLVTAATIDANASWKITIDGNALAEIKAQGDKTRNTLQYNTSSPRFSCYTGTQKSVKIYAKSPITTGIESIVTKDNSIVNIYSLTGVCIQRQVDAEKAIEGLAKGIYIIGNKKVVVK
ncbi:MAG: endonuclease [Bacteroidaceae bacterium]|nr:endonuclease [Bacteroidaceae bacterium]